jgi:MoaA/NifB/PqqE/SkfB family radical SAM enzyme
MEKSLCLEAFKSLTITTGNGSVTPCCAFNGRLANIDDVKDLREFFYDSPEMNSVREHELNGKWYLPGCSNCQKFPSSSRKSQFNNWLRTHKPADITPEEKPEPVHLSFDFSNHCNLTCVMCNGEYSSSWRKHDAHFNREVTPMRPESKGRQLSEEHFRQMLDLVQRAKILEIKGGEPLLEPHFDEFLREIAKTNPSIDISVTTNFTRMDQRKAELLSPLRNLALNVSIDGTHDLYEWMRGFSFKELEEKLLAYLPYFKNRFISINYTSTIYNFDRLEEFYNWVFELHKNVGIPICINFGIIAIWPDYVSPLLAADRSNALAQVERLLQDPLKFQYGRELYGRGLTALKSFLESPETLPESAHQKHRLWHDYLVKIRGWDVKKGGYPAKLTGNHLRITASPNNS